MALIVNQSNSEVYFGHLKVATATVAPGQVVVCDDSAGTCFAPGSDGAADVAGLALVCNYDPYADTDMTDSKDYTVAVGKYARLKALQVGDVITTDKVIGTVAVDDILAVNGTSGSGAIGSWIAVGTRTPVLTAKIIETTTVYGETAYKLRVISA